MQVGKITQNISFKEMEDMSQAEILLHFSLCMDLW